MLILYLSVENATGNTQKRQDFWLGGLESCLKEKRDGKPYFPQNRLLDSIPA
jgi:hypothetical protein